MERPGLAHTCAGIIDGKYDPTTQARTLRVHHRGADQASNGSIHSCASAFQDVPMVKREEKRQCYNPGMAEWRSHMKIEIALARQPQLEESS